MESTSDHIFITFNPETQSLDAFYRTERHHLQHHRAQTAKLTGIRQRHVTELDSFIEFGSSKTAHVLLSGDINI